MLLLSHSQTLQPILQGRAHPLGKGKVTLHFLHTVNHSASGQVPPQSTTCSPQAAWMTQFPDLACGHPEECDWGHRDGRHQSRPPHPSPMVS